MQTNILPRSTETLRELLDRLPSPTDHGPVQCSACGANRSVGRRQTDPPGEYLCLAGCGSTHREH